MNDKGDCGCDTAKQSIEEYLRNEVCATDAQDIRDHLAHCESCSDEAHVNAVLTDAVQRACKERAPEDLRREVLESIRTFQSSH